MKTLIGAALLILAAGTSGQAVQHPPTQAPASGAQSGSATTGAGSITQDQSEAYYDFTLAHLDEEEFEASGNSDYADKAIDLYTKALAISPDSPVIMERLAEVYAKTQHIRRAVSEAQEALKVDPNNVDAHRLLARIYVRLLGDLNAGQVQEESLNMAVEQLQDILKLDPSDDNSTLWLARLYRFQNKHDQAEQLLRDLLKREPDSNAALEQLSQLLLDEGRAQDAIELLSSAATDSGSPELYDLLGNAYAQTQDLPKSEEAYRKAVDLDPDDAGHRHGLAQALIAQDKFQDALDQYKRLSELEPESAENFLRMAQIYRRMNQLDAADKSLTRAKQLAPGSLEVLYSQALLYENEGRFKDAAQVLADAIAGVKGQQGSDANPNALGILYEQLGRIYLESQNYDAALKTYDDMAQLSPEAAKRSEVLKIDVYRQSRDIDRAVAEAQKALADSPKDQDLVVTYAMLLGEKGQTDDAVKQLRGLLQNKDSDQEIYVDIAQVQQQGRQYTDAEQSATKAEELAQKPEDKETVWFLLGAIYERQKKYDQAEQQFRKVLAQNPNNAATLNYLGYMLADRGVRLDEATALIQKAVDQEPVNGAYLDSLGWAYYKQNKLTEAQQYLSKAVDRDGQDPTILGHLGDVYLKMGENEQAADTFEKALAQWQKALPADYEPDRVEEVERQLKVVKRHLAQKTSPISVKPQ